MTILRLFLALTVFLALVACKSSEERAEQTYQRGLALLEAEDYARARIEFRNALAMDGTHVQAALELGRLGLRTGNSGAAFRNFLRVVEQDPENLEGLTNLTRLSFMRRNWEAFDRYAPRTVALAPESEDAKAISLTQDYRAAALADDLPKREALLEEARVLLDGKPDDPMLRQMLIDGYVVLNRFEEALTHLNTTIQDDPKNRRLYELKVQILGQLGDRSGVKETLLEMIGAFPGNAQYRQTYLQYLVSLDEIDTAEAFLRQGLDGSGPTSPVEAHTTLVRFIEEFRGPEAAMAELEDMIANRPNMVRLQSLRAALNFTSGERNAAIAELEALIALPEDALSQENRQSFKVTLARMLAVTGNEVGAQRLVEEILETDPNQGEAHKLQARWLIRDDETSAAITSLRVAMAENPEDAEAMTLMAEAYQRTGNQELRMEFLSLAVEAARNAPPETLRFAQALIGENRLPAARDILIASLRLNPASETVIGLLGQVYLAEKDYTRTQQVIDALRDLDTETALNMANALNLELVSQNSGNEEALKFLDQIANSSSGNDRTKLLLIERLLRSDRAAEAIEYVKELVDSNPTNEGYRYFRALTLMATGAHSEAEPILEELVANEPRAVLGWLQLARARQIMGNTEGAMSALEEGLSTTPGAADLLWAKASILERRGDIDAAIDIYEGLYGEFSSSPILANNLASLLSTYRQDAESLERAGTISQRLQNSDIPAFQDTYGWILHRQGRSEDALPYLEAAAQVLVQDPQVQINLGLVYAALGRQNDAQSQLVRARAAAGPVTSEAVRNRLEAFETEVVTP